MINVLGHINVSCLLDGKQREVPTNLEEEEPLIEMAGSV